MFCSEVTTDIAYFTKDQEFKKKTKENHQDFDQYLWSWSTNQILFTNRYF